MQENRVQALLQILQTVELTPFQLKVSQLANHVFQDTNVLIILKRLRFHVKMVTTKIRQLVTVPNVLLVKYAVKFPR